MSKNNVLITHNLNLSITLVNHFYPIRSKKKDTQGSPAFVNPPPPHRLFNYHTTVPALIYIGFLLARPRKNFWCPH
jgi:hypothetical protein